jgi:peptidyl-tRNA hydrolase
MTYGAIIMRCPLCLAESQYSVDDEKTEKSIRDRVLSRYPEKEKKRIARLVEEALEIVTEKTSGRTWG